MHCHQQLTPQRLHGQGRFALQPQKPLTRIARDNHCCGMAGIVSSKLNVSWDSSEWWKLKLFSIPWRSVSGDICPSCSFWKLGLWLCTKPQKFRKWNTTFSEIAARTKSNLAISHLLDVSCPLLLVSFSDMCSSTEFKAHIALQIFKILPQTSTNWPLATNYQWLTFKHDSAWCSKSIFLHPRDWKLSWSSIHRW